MDEEAKIRMGLDISPLDKALRAGEAKLEAWSDKIKDQFHEVGHEIMASLSIAGAIGLLENTFQKVQQISRTAESLDVSTDFVQNIENAGKASGITAEKMEKMLDTFIKGLPAGSDVEEEFYKTADAIAAIPDPAERARAAIDAFGKQGVKMIAVVRNGKAGIEELAAGFAHLSEEEIKAVEQAHIRIEQTESRLTVFAGKFINAVTLIGTAIGAKMGGMDLKDFFKDQADTENAAERAKKQAEEANRADAKAAAIATQKGELDRALRNYNEHLADNELKNPNTSFGDKMGILKRRFAEASAAAINEKDTPGLEQDYLRDLTKMDDLKHEMLELEKKHTDELEKQKKKQEEKIEKEAKYGHHLHENLSKEQHALSEARKSPYEFTLEDLAQSNGFESGMARQVVQLREFAKWNFMHGNFGRGEFQKNRAEEIFDALAKDNPYLKNPYQKMQEELQKQTGLLEDFNENGMPVYSAEE